MIEQSADYCWIQVRVGPNRAKRATQPAPKPNPCILGCVVSYGDHVLSRRGFAPPLLSAGAVGFQRRGSGCIITPGRLWWPFLNSDIELRSTATLATADQPGLLRSFCFLIGAVLDDQLVRGRINNLRCSLAAVTGLDL